MNRRQKKREKGRGGAAPVVEEAFRDLGVGADVEGQRRGGDGRRRVARERGEPGQPRVLPVKAAAVELRVGTRVQRTLRPVGAAGRRHAPHEARDARSLF